MDCPSEEQLIRMRLEGKTGVHALEINIPERQLVVYHAQTSDAILEALKPLQLGTSLLSSAAATMPPPLSERSKGESRLLWQVLGINFFFFLLEFFMGIFSDSMGLIADSLDMLADSLVYGLALLAVGGSLARKRRTARWSGYFQLFLAVLGLVEVVRRFVGLEAIPAFGWMVGISLLALLGNGLSLYLLQKTQSREVHIRASLIFTSNDIIINLGVILAGLLVYLSGSPYPDLVIGLIVFGIVARGAYRILQLSHEN